MQRDVGLPARADDAQRQAQAVAAAGYSVGWVQETTSDPFPAVTAALMATSGLKVGTGVAVAFARSPFVVAQAAWELARVSQGRFVLGLGTQVKAHNERRFSVGWDRPVDRMRDYIGALRAIWSAFQGEAPLDHRGPFYQHTLLTPLFNPGPIAHPRIPVFLAGVNRHLIALAGEVADGMIAHPLHSRRYLQETVLAAATEGLARSGRSRADLRIVVPVWVVTGETESEERAAREAVRGQISVYGSTRTYRAVFEAHGWGDLPDHLHVLMAERDTAAMAALITDEMVEAFAVCAPLDAIADRVIQRLDGLADAWMLHEPIPPTLARIGVVDVSP